MTHKLHTMSARDIIGMDMPPVRFIVPGLLPEGLTILAGKPKIGKSWLSLNIAMAVAAGSPVLGVPDTTAGDALYLALEDGDRRLQSRLKLMLGDERAPERLHLATKCPPLDQGGAEAIIEWIKSVPAARLVVVDVFARIKPKGTRSGRLYDEDYAASLPLKEIADERGIGIVIVTHARKAGADDDWTDAISATTGLAAAADTVMVLERTNVGTVLHTRGRDVEERDLALIFDSSTGAWKAKGDASEVNLSPQRRAIRNALLGTMGPKDISDVSGVSHEVVRKLLPEMVAAGDIEKIDRGQYSLAARPA